MWKKREWGGWQNCTAVIISKQHIACSSDHSWNVLNSSTTLSWGVGSFSSIENSSLGTSLFIYLFNFMLLFSFCAPLDVQRRSTRIAAWYWVCTPPCQVYTISTKCPLPMSSFQLSTDTDSLPGVYRLSTTNDPHSPLQMIPRRFSATIYPLPMSHHLFRETYDSTSSMF